MAERIGEQELDALPAIPLRTWLLMLMAVIAGALAATIVLPAFLPGLTASFLGPEPKAYWHLARSSAFVAFVLLWLSMALGLIITNKMARVWPGGPTAYDLHQHVSLLSMAFALFHGLILIGDRFINLTLSQVLIPFTGVSYRPGWVGLGQVGIYLLVIVGLSFYVRRPIGRRAWRLVHLLSYVLFVLGLMHGIMSGTDSAAWWAKVLYWTSGGSVLFLTAYRILVSSFKAPSSSVARSRALLENQSGD